jgi:hypothetical protein
MSAGDKYVKTPAGLDEIQTRKLKLPHRLRCMLIMIDGSQPEFLMVEDAKKFGAPADFLSELLKLGLIAKVSSSASSVATVVTAAEAPIAPASTDEYSRFRAAKDFMNVTLVEALGVGVKSFLFTLKLEKAATCADLKELIAPYEKALIKTMGDVEAEVLVKRLQKMLG